MAKMYKMAFWMHEMIKRMLDISPQASVLKTLSFLELPFSKVATHFL
ncbi:unknown [Prevotella sp. CAG:1092]|nr:unknown [Prevotella sp. CAG:1092]